jgi:hypothetical protein
MGRSGTKLTREVSFLMSFVEGNWLVTESILSMRSMIVGRLSLRLELGDDKPLIAVRSRPI